MLRRFPVRLTARLLAASLLLIAAAGGGGCNAVKGDRPTNAQRADRLANGVALASGAAAWPRVRTIAFTYTVRDTAGTSATAPATDAPVRLARTHVWNLRDGTDTVSVGDRTTTINLNNVDTGDPAQADALAAWRNDTAWLLAPLRLYEKGVRREYLGQRDVAGKTYEVLRVTSDATGPVPTGEQTLYVDPYTSLVAFSDQAADASTDTAAPAEQATWEQYRHRQNLVLSTHHRAGPRVISIDNLSVAAD